MGAYDVERKNPPLYLVWHHAVSPEMRGWSDQQVADWFNDIGRSRTYAGYAHSYHYDPRTRQETFAAVQIALVPNGDHQDIYSDTWRIVQLVDDSRGQVCWHAGNWSINCNSIGCETAGRYDDKELPDNAIRALADWARNNIDVWNGGKTIVAPHNQFTSTACPGNIAKRIPQLIDYINNTLSMEERQQLQAKIDLFQQYINARDDRIKMLENVNADQVKGLTAYEADKQNWIHDREELNKTIEGFKSQISGSIADSQELQRQKDVLTREYDRLNEQLAEKGIELINSQNELKKCQSTTRTTSDLNSYTVGQLFVTFITKLFRKEK